MSDPIDWQGRRQHGTRSSYSGGCRCTPCRQAQAEANRYISDCLRFALSMSDNPEGIWGGMTRRQRAAIRR